MLINFWRDFQRFYLGKRNNCTGVGEFKRDHFLVLISALRFPSNCFPRNLPLVVFMYVRL